MSISSPERNRILMTWSLALIFLGNTLWGSLGDTNKSKFFTSNPTHKHPS